MLEAFIDGFTAGSIHQLEILKNLYDGDPEIQKRLSQQTRNYIEPYTTGDKFTNLNAVLNISGVLVGTAVILPGAAAYMVFRVGKGILRRD